MSTGKREPPPTPENDLDAAVADTFPASDPVSMQQPVVAAPSVEEHEHSAPGPRLVYRVVERSHADDAFGVERNRKGGRWTSDDVCAAYASTSAAGAAMEFLAHLEGDSPEDLVIVTAMLPGEAVTTIDTLPAQWRERPYRDDVRAVGDGWAREKRSLALEVPSVLCAPERNVLVNPEHPDAGQVKIRAIDPFHIDPRLRY
ncbi:RES family NAD+ phosphorylase [Lysobacter korlensis]|uniref:RES family NAD+ phosphorylase n=1 Tax=Lysobacter korlensis TaxID=553636 RepID=A0ABV6RII1_9GAMM